VRKFNQFASSLEKKGLSEEKFQEKVTEYAKTRLVPAFVAYRKTKEGAAAAEDVDRELVLIAVQIAGDDTVIEQVLAWQKSPEKVLQLMLFAAEQYGEFGNVKQARALIDAVLKESESKFPEVQKEAQFALLRVAPEGLVFPEFPEWAKDMDGKPIRIADNKGKIVLVDFWATWCGPCRDEAPNVVETYQKYHDKGFEIIGISFDKSKGELLKFTSKAKITWRQYFDGLVWDNKVGKVYAIHSIPAMYLVGKDGKVISNEVRGGRLTEILDKELGGEK
jgi:thiol-disulfide isomerase/thioredoxin